MLRTASLLPAGALAALGLLAQAGPGPDRVSPGAPLERRIGPGEAHSYELDIPSGHGLRVAVEQQGVDLVLHLAAPDGSPLAAADSPNGRWGVEALATPAGAPSTLRLTVEAPGPWGMAGSYRLAVEELAAAGPAAAVLAAERAMTRGAGRYLAGTAADWRAALADFAAALPAWRRAGRRGDEARALHTLGVLHRLLDEPAPARRRLDEALAAWRAAGDRRGEAACLNELGYALWLAGEPAPARMAYEGALGLARSLADSHGEAQALNNLGLLHHAAGAPDLALPSYRRALELFRRERDLPQAAKVANNLAGVHDLLGAPESALAGYREALELLRATGERREEGRTLSNLATLLRTLGRFGEALDLYGQALDLFRALGDRRGEGTALNNLAMAYAGLGDDERALALLGEALPLRRQAGDRRGEGTTRHNLGLLAARLGRAGEALGHFRQALELRRAVGDRPGEATTLDQIGALELARGEAAAALATHTRALELRISAGDPARQASTLARLAEAQLAAGRAAEAEAGLARALALQRGAGDRAGQAETLFLLARAARAAGRLEEASTSLEEALAGIESLRAGVADPDLRASYLAARRGSYELYVDLAMALDRRDPAAGHCRRALAASERARARTLLELVAAAGGPVPEPALDARPLTAGEIQDLLDPGTLLLEFSLGEERSFLWAVTRDRLEARELPPRRALETAALQLYRSWSDPVAGGERDGEAERQAAELSRLLLGPVAGLLPGHRLAVVPDGALHYLPFAALPLPAPGAAAGAGTAPAPLVSRHEVVVLPSASVLAAQRRALAGRPPAAGAVAVLADPVFDAADVRVVGRVAGRAAAAGSAEPPLDRLAATRREAEAILAFAPEGGGETLAALGFAADRAAVLGGSLERFRIVHFATHGVLDTQRPERSGLVLSRVDREGRPRDGFLGLRDVHGLSLRADLVVLSGCRTALGREVRGEGLVGLARGFFQAGARRVLASLWRVEDRATADLMTRFYGAHLGAGRPPAAALREAQAALAAERGRAHPSRWAGFVLLGDWR